MTVDSYGLPLVFAGRTLTVVRHRGDELGEDGGQVVHPTEVFLTVADPG